MGELKLVEQPPPDSQTQLRAPRQRDLEPLQMIPGLLLRGTEAQESPGPEGTCVAKTVTAGHMPNPHLRAGGPRGSRASSPPEPGTSGHQGAPPSTSLRGSSLVPLTLHPGCPPSPAAPPLGPSCFLPPSPPHRAAWR